MIFVVNLSQKSSCNISVEGDEVGFNNNNNNIRKHISTGMGKNNSGDRYINHNNKKNEQNDIGSEVRSSGAKDYLMREHQRNAHQPM